MGGLMSSQITEFEWRKIEESSNLWNFLDNVSSAIKLSFDHLPSLVIKQCFIYCSIFPKDSIIRKKDLIQQWMAHGLLNPSRESDLEMETVGNNYFNILLQRSFLQECKFDDLFGNIISCKMHDLVHDFALEASKGRVLIAKVGELTNENIKSVMHLSIELDQDDYITSLNISKMDFSRLRTLHLIGKGNLSRHFLDHCKSKNLRVLTIVDLEMFDLPISIANMKHLRYLDITKTMIYESLPEFVSKFCNMQTFKAQMIENLPRYFFQLFNLRHWNMSRLSFLFYDKNVVPYISKFNHLLSLNYFNVSRQNGCHIEELCNLTKLEGHLEVAGLENVANQDDAKKANLLGKCYIDSLVLVWGINNIDNNNKEVGPSRNDQSVAEGLQPHPSLKALTIGFFKGKFLPSWIVTLRNLKTLILQDLEKCEQISPLGHLPFLMNLEIASMKSLKYITNDFYGWSNLVIGSVDSSHQSTCSSTIVIFRSLVELRVIGLESLNEWSDMVIPTFLSSSSIVAFPSLKLIYIISCPSLSYLPQVLFSASTSLESPSFHSCSELVSHPNMTNFRPLEKLRILACSELKVIPLGIDSCTSLRSLKIVGPISIIQSLVLPYLINLKSFSLYLSSNIVDPYSTYSTISSSKLESNYSSSSSFSSKVEKLTLFGEPQFKSLPEEIQYFTSLRSLTIGFFHGLETIPEWIGKFHSLERLYLESCESLANFPSKEVMCSLTNLKYLNIHHCFILSENCNIETGAEWHKIAHIPTISHMWKADSSDDDLS